MTEEFVLFTSHSKIRNIEIGDTIQFGRYTHNKDGKDQTPIEWIVLDKEAGKALITSKYAIDCKQYNTSYTNVTWETCSLRTWLNGMFLNNAFSAEEKAQIQETTVSADKIPKFNINPGNATTDKVFLLSISEAKKYFKTAKLRRCAPTAYAEAQGAYTDDEYKTASGEATCWWWLRSPGCNLLSAATVDYDGSVDYEGLIFDDDDGCVRPALWINLES